MGLRPVRPWFWDEFAFAVFCYGCMLGPAALALWWHQWQWLLLYFVIGLVFGM